MVGNVDDFDLAADSTQEAFAIGEARDDRDDVSVAWWIGAPNARSGREAGTNMPTHRVPAEAESR